MILIEVLGILSIVAIMVLVNRDRFNLDIEVKEEWAVIIRMFVILIVLFGFFYTHYTYTNAFIEQKDANTGATYENWKVHPDDKAAFEWINENTEKDASILSIRTYLYLYYTDRKCIYTTGDLLGDLHTTLEMDPKDSSTILKYRDGIDYIVIDTTWTSIYPQYNQWPADFVYGTLPGAETYYKLEFSQGKIRIYSLHPPENNVL